jgi:signal peptidase
MTSRWSSPSRLRVARTGLAVVLTWLLVGLLGGLVWSSTGGHLAGVRAMAVLSGSMEPTLGVGDLIVARVITPAEAEAGDVLVYRDSARDRFVTHRVQSIVRSGDQVDVVTRGDANSVGEQWSAPADGSVGRVVLHIPFVGYATGALGTSAGRLALTAVATVLTVWTLRLLWWPRRPPVVIGAQPVHAAAAERRRRPRAEPAHRTQRVGTGAR